MPISIVRGGVYITGIWFRIICIDSDRAIFECSGVLAHNHSAHAHLKQCKEALQRVEFDIKNCSEAVSAVDAAAVVAASCADELVQHLVEKHNIEQKITSLMTKQADEFVPGLRISVNMGEWTKVGPVCIYVPPARKPALALCL